METKRMIWARIDTVTRHAISARRALVHARTGLYPHAARIAQERLTLAQETRRMLLCQLRGAL